MLCMLTYLRLVSNAALSKELNNDIDKRDYYICFRFY